MTNDIDYSFFEHRILSPTKKNDNLYAELSQSDNGIELTKSEKSFLANKFKYNKEYTPRKRTSRKRSRTSRKRSRTSRKRSRKTHGK